MGIYAAALTIGALLPIFIQKLFIAYKRFDDINHRSSHNTLATRTGGIGVFLTLFGITLYQYALGDEIFDFSLLIPLSIMFIVGVYDDLYNADFKLKFLLQIIVAKMLIDQGYVITNYHGLFGLYEVPWLLAQLSTVFVFLVVVNAVNFIDGIDGLAITEVIKSIVVIELFSIASTPLYSLGGIVIAALLPLYYFNFKIKRKVFLGDAGSLLLGSLIIVYLLYVLGPEYRFKEGYAINKVLFTVLVAFYPLVDLLRVFILRIKDGQSPFKADQRHLHHRLLKNKSHALKVLIIELLVLTLLYSFTIFL